MGSHTLVCHEVVLAKATSAHSGWCSSGSCLFLVGQGRRQSKRDTEARATTCGDALWGSSLSPWCRDTCSLICEHWCGNICVLKSRAGERESLLATTADANLDHRSFTVRYIQSLKHVSRTGLESLSEISCIETPASTDVCFLLQQHWHWEQSNSLMLSDWQVEADSTFCHSKFVGARCLA